MKTLDFAMGLAHRSSLVVVESVSHPVGGWAAATGAINLLTEEHGKLDPALVKHLDRLVFYGNNALAARGI